MKKDTWQPLKTAGKWLGGGMLVLLVVCIGVLAFSKPPVPNGVYGQSYTNDRELLRGQHFSYDHVLVNTRITFGKNYMTVQRGPADTGKAGTINTHTPLSVKQVVRDNYLATYVRKTPEMQINVDKSYRQGGQLVLVLQDGKKLRFSKYYTKFTVGGQVYAR